MNAGAGAALHAAGILAQLAGEFGLQRIRRAAAGGQQGGELLPGFAQCGGGFGAVFSGSACQRAADAPHPHLVLSVAQGRDDCVIADHHIESKTVYRALTIIVIGALAAFGSAVVVYYNTSDAVSVIDAIFESCSAFGTVGLSVGVTARLKDGAKLLYMAVMFMGRVGPVSLAMSLTAKPDDNKRKIMPVGHINVG